MISEATGPQLRAKAVELVSSLMRFTDGPLPAEERLAHAEKVYNFLAMADDLDDYYTRVEVFANASPHHESADLPVSQRIDNFLTKVGQIYQYVRTGEM